MSKQGVNTTPTKQDNNSFKKDNRNQNSGLNINVKEERRSGGFNSTPGNQQGRGGGQNQNNSNQNNQQHDRDRSSNRNENKQFDNKPVTETEKTAEKDDKNVEGSTGGTGPAPGEKKFTGRCRLFVGNLTPDVTESDFRKMFEPFGEIAEVYVNTSRGFGFIRLDYRQNAEAAKAALDGHQRKGRILRVRFATHGAALKVKNLHPYVSNELLEQSFSQFGELERCVVIVDDRGKPTGEGIVEFVRKPGANSALRRINEGVFLMGIDPKPVAVEPLEQKDEEDGMPEKFLTKTDQYKKEREKEPRFAPPGTFEYEFGMRWKALEDLEKQRIEQIKKDTEEARLKLEDEMQNALYEYQAEQIRQDLLRQQEELRRLEELRKQDRMRRQQEMELRRQQDDRERAQQEERRRTDMMLSMRQQELARGRGPLDSRGRDDILMADRYGDRMSDRMPDRMGDRMSDRIGDRMGPGQSGFMWDDNQRGEAGMRGDGGRGRDMRGSGAPPLQPPPVPPSGPGALERGGQSMAASAQSSKSSPKPLMGTSGFGNIGNQPGNAPGANNPSASSDNSNMAEEDVNEESICSVNDAESQNIVTTTENDLDNSRLDIPPVSLKVEGEDVHHTIEKCQLPTNNFSPDLNEEEHPGLWSAPTHYNDGSMDESENIPSSRPPVVLPLDKDRKDNTTENPTKKPRCDYDFNTTPSEQTPCDLSTSKSLCFSTPRNNTFFVGNSSSELLTKLNSKSKENCMDEPEMDIDETYLDGIHSKDKIDPGGRVKPPLQRYLSADDVSDEQTVPKEFKIQRYLSADNMDLTGVQSYLSNDIVPVECSSLHSNESYQSIDTLHISESNNYKPSDVPSQYTSSDAQSITETSKSDHSY
uniref:RRM domain-containing protein n=1 Tax=Biomphalaria glabrata TaxID=6526 RepID=A0A2C9JCF7_BIOGL